MERIYVSPGPVGTTPLAGDSGVILSDWTDRGYAEYLGFVPTVNSFQLTGSVEYQIGVPTTPVLVMACVVIEQPLATSTQMSGFNFNTGRPGLTITYEDDTGVNSKLVDSNPGVTGWRQVGTSLPMVHGYGGQWAFLTTGPTVVTISFEQGYGAGVGITDLPQATWKGSVAIFLGY